MPLQNASRRLARALNDHADLVLPGAYDAFSAKLIQGAGFKAAYVGSYATAAAGFGLPDVGVMTLDQLVRTAASIADAVDLPVIADAEGGFFDPANMWRTVRDFEVDGVAAIYIEDHAGAKHTDLPQALIPLDVMLDRLRAALDARRSEDFIITARTDAIRATHDTDEAVKRIRAFAKIGIEYFFPNGATPKTLREIRKQVPGGKFITINLPTVRNRMDWLGAADLVIDYGFCLQAVAKSLTSALAQFRASAIAEQTDALIEDAATLEARLGYDDYTRRSLKYAVPRSEHPTV